MRETPRGYAKIEAAGGEDERYLRLCEAFQYVDDVFLDIVEREKGVRRREVKKSVKRIWGAVAACICVLIVLPAAAMAYNWFGLKELLLPKKEKTPDAFSLSAYQESPAYQAAAEWKVFLAGYDMDGRILSEAEKTGFVTENESWKLYGVYSREMGERLGEIADKYELRLHTGGRTIEQDTWESLVTGSFLAGGSTKNGFLYEDSSFSFAGSMEIAGYGKADFDACFVAVNVLAGSDEGMTEEGLQELADRIDFRVLKEVQTPDMRGDSEVE